MSSLCSKLHLKSFIKRQNFIVFRLEILQEFAVVGLIDGEEMRGYLEDGWVGLLPKGPEPPPEPHLLRFSLASCTEQ